VRSAAERIAYLLEQLERYQKGENRLGDGEKVAYAELLEEIARSYRDQTLRSCFQPLQRWEMQRAALETEEPLECVDTQMALMPFPLQDTKGDQATGEMMQRRPLRTCLTAR
jgi:hypothetical protein